MRELRWLGVSEEEIKKRSEAAAMASIELKKRYKRSTKASKRSMR